MTTVYLHVGLHHTGTTTIQASLHAARALLEKHRLAYPDLGANHSAALCALAADREHLGRGDGRLSDLYARFREQLRKAQAPEARRRTAESIVASLDSGRYDKAVLSAEEVPYVREDELASLRSFLVRYGGEIVVVLYLRRPAAMASAHSRLLVQWGGTLPGSPEESPAPGFSDVIRPLLEVFGEDRLVFRPFPLISAEKGDLIEDFLGTAGCGEVVRQVPRLTRNESWSDTAVRVLDRYNRRYLNTSWAALDQSHPERSARYGAKSWLGMIGGARFRFEPDFARRVAALHANDQEWVEGLCGFELPVDPKLEMPGPECTDPALYDRLAVHMHELVHAHAARDYKRAEGAARAVADLAPPDCEIGERFLRRAAGG